MVLIDRSDQLSKACGRKKSNAKPQSASVQPYFDGMAMRILPRVKCDSESILGQRRREPDRENPMATRMPAGFLKGSH